VITVCIYEKEALFARAPLRSVTLVRRLHHGAADGAFGLAPRAFGSTHFDVGHAIWRTEKGDADFTRPDLQCHGAARRGPDRLCGWPGYAECAVGVCGV
jgi:hypothetical protein